MSAGCICLVIISVIMLNLSVCVIELINYYTFV